MGEVCNRSLQSLRRRPFISEKIDRFSSLPFFATGSSCEAHSGIFDLEGCGEKKQLVDVEFGMSPIRSKKSSTMIPLSNKGPSFQQQELLFTPSKVHNVEDFITPGQQKEYHVLCSFSEPHASVKERIRRYESSSGGR